MNACMRGSKASKVSTDNTKFTILFTFCLHILAPLSIGKGRGETADRKA